MFVRTSSCGGWLPVLTCRIGFKDTLQSDCVHDDTCSGTVNGLDQTCSAVGFNLSSQQAKTHQAADGNLGLDIHLQPLDHVDCYSDTQNICKAVETFRRY